ncbi:hypothetical protein AOLI_G00273610 [Acnodon oligacanthus]
MVGQWERGRCGASLCSGCIVPSGSQDLTSNGVFPLWTGRCCEGLAGPLGCALNKDREIRSLTNATTDSGPAGPVFTTRPVTAERERTDPRPARERRSRPISGLTCTVGKEPPGALSDGAGGPSGMMEDWVEGVLGSVCVDGAEGVLEQVERWEVCLRLLENLSLELLAPLTPKRGLSARLVAGWRCER